MKLLTAAQMRALDRHAIDVLGVPSPLLMTTAARHVAQAAQDLLTHKEGPVVAVFCGPGNNGGDGVAAALFLRQRGVTVRAFLVGQRDKMTADTQEMERRLNDDGGRLEAFADTPDARDFTFSCDVIIDAIFGIGLNTTLRGTALEAVRLINAADAPVVAADLPTGIDADTGAILGDAVHAQVTVTFSFGKPGQYVEPGCTYCGTVLIREIGIPETLLKNLDTDTYAVVPGDITLPRRRPDTHKGDYGRDLIIAGSVGFSGAPVLAARAASASGAGLVHLGVPQAIYQIAAVKCTEEMPFPLACTAEGALGGLALYAILDKLSAADACLVGPGLGQSAVVREIVAAVLKEATVPIILDADGINAVSGNINAVDEATVPVVLTPHLGEFRRLGGDISGVGRLLAARRFAVRHQCVLVLKGHRTITALPDGTAYINTTGGPAMAKAGSGDVLAGIITAFIGQKFPLKDAVLAAVYLHGLAGDMCAETLGEYSVTAGSLLGALPNAIKTVLS